LLKEEEHKEGIKLCNFEEERQQTQIDQNNQTFLSQSKVEDIIHESTEISTKTSIADIKIHNSETAQEYVKSEIETEKSIQESITFTDKPLEENYDEIVGEFDPESERKFEILESCFTHALMMMDEDEKSEYLEVSDRKNPDSKPDEIMTTQTQIKAENFESQQKCIDIEMKSEGALEERSVGSKAIDEYPTLAQIFETKAAIKESVQIEKSNESISEKTFDKKDDLFESKVCFELEKEKLETIGNLKPKEEKISQDEKIKFEEIFKVDFNLVLSSLENKYPEKKKSPSFELESEKSTNDVEDDESSLQKYFEKEVEISTKEQCLEMKSTKSTTTTTIVTKIEKVDSDGNIIESSTVIRTAGNEEIVDEAEKMVILFIIYVDLLSVRLRMEGSDASQILYN